MYAMANDPLNKKPTRTVYCSGCNIPIQVRNKIAKIEGKTVETLLPISEEKEKKKPNFDIFQCPRCNTVIFVGKEPMIEPRKD